MRKLVWWVVFILLVVWLRSHYNREKPIIDAERECIQNSVSYDDTQECFKLMDRNKAIREQR